MLYTRAAGRTSIRLTVHTLDPAAGQFEGNVTEFSHEVQISVFHKLTHWCPECHSEQFLMSTNSEFKLLRDTYVQEQREREGFVNILLLQSFPNSSVIEKSEHGLLKTGTLTGTAVLEVTSLEPFGVNQTIITGVRVAPVSYLQINITPKLYTANRMPLCAFPLGMSLTLTVAFYDNIGEKFHAQSTQLYLALNRDDLLHIRPGNKNYTYIAQAVKRGVTLIGIWDEKHPGMADYIPVPVEHAIEPNVSELLIIGDVVCFSTTLVNEEGESGTWQVERNDILQIDPVSGAALAKSPGKTTVYYDIPGIVKTYREVVISDKSKLNLLFGPKKYLTNAPNSSEFLVFMTTNSNRMLKGNCTLVQLNAVTNVLSPESHLVCQVQFSKAIPDIPAHKVFHIQSAFYADKGHYGCIVRVKEQSQDDLQDMSTSQGSVYVTVSLISKGQEQTQTVVVPFLPAFYITQSDIIFSSQQLSNEITVIVSSGMIKNLEAQPSNPVIMIRQPNHLQYRPGLVFPVYIANLSSVQKMTAPIFVNISCSLTGQWSIVLVRALSEDNLLAQDMKRIPSYYYSIAVVLVSVLAIGFWKSLQYLRG